MKILTSKIANTITAKREARKIRNHAVWGPNLGFMHMRDHKLEMVPARCKVKVPLHHTYITLPKVTSWYRKTLVQASGQEGLTKVFVIF